VWSCLVAGLLVGLSFDIIVVGNAEVDISVPVVWANVVFGWLLVAVIVLTLVTTVTAIHRHHLYSRATVTAAICVACCVTPAVIVFQTPSYWPVQPAGPEFMCQSWRRPLNPAVGSWNGQTMLCIGMAVPILDADAVALSLGADLSHALSSTVYVIALTLCSALLVGGTLPIYRVTKME
jgi:hypothetical protein